MTTDAGRQKLKTEAGSAGKFALVGIAATLTHAGIAGALLESGSLTAMAANACGFLVAFAVSFFGHYYWSFSHLRSGDTAIKAMLRFFVIAVLGFAVNALTLTLWLDLTPWPDLLGLMFAIAVVPALTFAGARLWAFSHGNADT